MIYILVIGLLAIIYWLFMSPYAQAFGVFPFRAATTDKIIALTFDDGPNEPFTSEIIDYLDNKNIQATFFQVGKNVAKYPSVTARAVANGHVVGNHSFSHQFFKYFSQPDFRKEIIQTQEVIKQTTGKTPALFRPPWLWRQPWLLKTARSQGLKPISGEFGHKLEVFQPKARIMASRAIKKVRPGSIIIFHDGFDARGGNRTQTVEAIKLVVEELTEQGWKFVTVDKLLDIPAYQ